MRHVLLGHTGLRVSEIALGTMTFGTEWGFGTGRDGARAIFDCYASAGGNFIDTSVNYTDGTSERLLGEFLGADRERFVVATKYGITIDRSQPNAGGTHRKSLRHAVTTSLSRLGTDYLDVLYVHFWDYHTPLEETMRALDDLVRSGLVLYLGISDSPAWVVARAQTYALERGLTPFAVVQAPYSLLERTPERELLPAVDALGLTLAAWSVLGRGVLTGKYNLTGKDNGTAASGPGGDAAASVRLSGDQAPGERDLAIAQVTTEVARAAGATPAQVATAWAMRLGYVVPVLGARSAGQLAEGLASADLVLSADALARLDAVSDPGDGYPTAMLRDARPFFLGTVLETTRDARRGGVLPGT